MLQKPFLALCSNRASSPKHNATTGSPEDWFDNGLLIHKKLIGFSFDFFVNWATNQISPFVWVKRILTAHPSALYYNGEINTDLISKEIIALDSLSNLKLFVKFCSVKNLALQYLLFREIDWSKNAEDIFVVSITMPNDELIFNVEAITLNELQRRIRAYSGGSIRVGAKGLMYGTSMLECFLSKTDSLYPGDMDLVIVDAETIEIRALLEYKKHNLDSPIENEKLGNYYPHPDHRKYDRLAILRDYLNSVPKFICIYYPTKSVESAKVEIIMGNAGTLKSGNSRIINLPRFGDTNTYNVFVDDVLCLD